MIQRLAARRIPGGPEEGWLSLGLVMLMTVTAAWSIDDVGWVLGQTDWTNFLVWATVFGVAIGFVGSKVVWGRWSAHIIGATFAAGIVPTIASARGLPDGS